MRYQRFRLKLVSLMIFFLTTTSGQSMDRISGNVYQTRSEVFGQNGVVATSHPLASTVGLDILKAGGNAIDAAIAANAAIGLMEPTGNGIGGDLFAIIWNAKEKKLYGLNASGRSPAGLNLEQMRAELKKLGRNDIPPYGLLPISVPGTVDGWFEMHAKFGKMPMDKILAPAVDYARRGFPVTELIAYYWNSSVPLLKDQPGDFKKVFTINGKAPQKGQIFKNPDLADTYQLIAEKGRDAFYKGEIAKKVDAFMRKSGGFLRFEDFASHRSDWVEPMKVNYRGYDVYELPPNGQGIAVLQMLQILEQYDLSKMGFFSAEALHVMIEAKKRVFEDRAKYYADPEFSKADYQRLLSKSYANERKKLIGDRASKTVEAGTSILEKGDTIYLTTADRWGNMVSLIQSNYRGMGSGVVVPGTGFGFQDRGQQFSLDKKHANVYAPKKRPFHTIIPAFVLKDGKPFLSFGLMGGGMQPQGHVQIITNIIDFGMNIQAAGDAPRWQHFGSTEPTAPVSQSLKDGGYVTFESELTQEVRRELMLRGHQIRSRNGGFGGYQAIQRLDNGVYSGASESRKDGQAVAY